ncbi:hypothetical protein BaRGS_00012116 [Batillaria attramentaria]|uniref:Uncharacterized protein n=1 Tax=Batillaria attramentaria TaxID=370345 RepID=A0ABD0LB70_9CAEN
MKLLLLSVLVVLGYLTQETRGQNNSSSSSTAVTTDPVSATGQNKTGNPEAATTTAAVTTTTPIPDGKNGGTCRGTGTACDGHAKCSNSKCVCEDDYVALGGADCSGGGRAVANLVLLLMAAIMTLISFR